MAALNYKHLRYFWAVAKAGSIARASEQLYVTPQSISGQLSELESALGAALFRRAGRGLDLTEAGRRALGYADKIFSLGDELLDAVRERQIQAAPQFRIGIADSVPKSVTYAVVQPVLHLAEPVRIICREGRLVALLADLAVHRLDLVIADRQMPANINVKAYNHLLGSSDLTVFAAPALARSLKSTFPGCIDGAPFLMPGESVAIRPGMERWFASNGIAPRVVGEFDDGALMKAFGQSGVGLFAAPTAIGEYVRAQYGVTAVGRIDGILEELYAISTERRIQHPAVIAVSEAAAREVFVKSGKSHERKAANSRRAIKR